MMGFLMQNAWIAWLIVAVLFVAAELLTTALVSIWFVPGAILSAVLSLFVDNIVVQILVFLTVSVMVLVISKKYFRKTPAEKLVDVNGRLVGKIAVAKTAIHEADGKVLVGDVYWRAVSDTPIEEGTYVTVTAISGNTLVVEKKQEKEN